MSIPTMHQVSSWENKSVLVRAGVNVPLQEDGSIADDFRLERILPTLVYLQEQGARIIVLGHSGRSRDANLAAVAAYLEKFLTKVSFFPGFFADDIEKNIEQLKSKLDESKPGSVFVLDNVRATKKEAHNDEELAARLASLASVYINEAFSVSHRAHMSLEALPRAVSRSYAGFACEEETEELGMALTPARASLAIIGGNKFETKLPLIEKFLKEYDTLVIGGALANTLYALRGYEIGRSVYENNLSEETKQALERVLTSPRLFISEEVVCQDSAGKTETKHISEVKADDAIYDLAPSGLEELAPRIANAPTVVWNGPLGYSEEGFTEGSKYILEELKKSEAYSLVGGGNTVDLVRSLGYRESISFLSTGGGAMIEYLSRGTLPALEALHT